MAMPNDLSALAGNPLAALPDPAERVRLREAFGITQQKLADALSVSRRTVILWEHGATEPTGANRTHYAEILTLWSDTERKSKSEEQS